MYKVGQKILGFIILSLVLVAGFQWGQNQADPIGTIQVHLFGGFSSTTGKLVKGFACFCKNSNGTKYWDGKGSNTCYGTTTGGIAMTLKDNNIKPTSKQRNVGMPEGACCTTFPNIKGVRIPKVESLC